MNINTINDYFIIYASQDISYSSIADKLEEKSQLVRHCE